MLRVRTGYPAAKGCDLVWNFFHSLFEALVQPLLCGTVRTFPATAPGAARPGRTRSDFDRSPPAPAYCCCCTSSCSSRRWPAGPRIGASVPPAPGWWPRPGQPGRRPRTRSAQPERPGDPRGTTATPTSSGTTPPTPLPTATTPGIGATTARVPGESTPYSTPAPGRPGHHADRRPLRADHPGRHQDPTHGARRSARHPAHHQVIRLPHPRPAPPRAPRRQPPKTQTRRTHRP